MKFKLSENVQIRNSTAQQTVCSRIQVRSEIKFAHLCAVSYMLVLMYILDACANIYFICSAGQSYIGVLDCNFNNPQVIKLINHL